MGRLSEYKLSDLFSFEERDITRHMMYEMKMGYKFKDAFNYVLTKLPVKKLPADLGRLKWDEGKNYDWVIIKDGKVTIIFRQYRLHYTIFFKVDGKENNDWYNKYGCLSFHTNTDHLPDDVSDSYCDDNFRDMNKYIKPLIKELAGGNVHGLWNPLCFKADDEERRPDHIEAKNIWNGGDEDISSINDFIFCCDELFEKYLELFAKNEMMARLKTIKVGDMLNSYKVLEVRATTKDEYYHDAGLKLKGTNGKDSADWKDVYCLTRWYLEDVFPELATKES